MDLLPEENDIGKLKAENLKLKNELRKLVIEKNRMEDRLMRATNRVLNSKKKRIVHLEKEVERLQQCISGDPVCSTCKHKVQETKSENSEGDRRSSKKAKVARNVINSDDDDTQDPASGYGSDTDLDDGPPSSVTSPKKSAAASQPHPPEQILPSSMTSSCSENKSSDRADKQMPKEPIVTPVPEDKKETEMQSTTAIVNLSNSEETDYEMDDLVDDFLS